MKRWLIRASIVIGLAAVWLVAQWLWTPEPTYMGTSLQEWRSHFGTTSPADYSKRFSALLDNPLPATAVEYLANGVHTYESPLHKWYAKRRRELPPILSTKLPKVTRRPTQFRYRMAILMARLGPKARKASPDLVIALQNDPEVKVRAAAARALGKIRNDSEPVCQALFAALEDPSPGVRQAVATALADLNGQSQRFLSTLAPLLNDPHFQVRSNAIKAIAEISSGSREAVTALKQGLTDNNTIVVRSALTALARIGAPARSAIPQLQRVPEAHPSLADITSWALEEIQRATNE